MNTDKKLYLYSGLAIALSVVAYVVITKKKKSHSSLIIDQWSASKVEDSRNESFWFRGPFISIMAPVWKITSSVISIIIDVVEVVLYVYQVFYRRVRRLALGLSLSLAKSNGRWDSLREIARVCCNTRECKNKKRVRCCLRDIEISLCFGKSNEKI